MPWGRVQDNVKSTLEKAFTLDGARLKQRRCCAHDDLRSPKKKKEKKLAGFIHTARLSATRPVHNFASIKD